jgi:DNA-binding transcriptional MerR regulator
MLRVLTDIGIPLKQIKELAEMRTPDKMIKLLCENRELVASEIRYLQELHSVINTFTDLLGEAMCATEAEISVAEMPEKRIILGEANDFCNETGFMGEFTRFCDSTLSPKLNLSFPIGGYWDSMDSFLKDPSKPMRFFSIDPKGNESKPAGQYLVGYTRGYYGETNGLPERMAEYASENKLDLSSPVYNIYLSDEISETNPQNYLLQVSTAVSGICRPPMRFAMRKKHITE